MAPIPRVGILIFDEVEVLDFCGPFEVFSVARRPDAPDEPLFEVLTIAETVSRPIVARNGLQVLPSTSFETCPSIDWLVVPGGRGTRRVSQETIDWVRARARDVERLVSVCTGALILASAGCLDGRRATTHWQAFEELRDRAPGAEVVEDLHFVDEGRVLTSAGISAGIDLSLHLVAQRHGEAVGRHTARYMEYPYPEGNARRI